MEQKYYEYFKGGIRTGEDRAVIDFIKGIIKDELQRLREQLASTHAEQQGYECALDDMESFLTN